MNGSPSGKALAEGKGLLRRTSTRAAAAVASGTLVLASSGIAWADDISNSLDTSIDATAEILPLNVGGANGNTTLAVSPTGEDGKNGCNLTGSTTLTLNLTSSNPAVATVSPSTVTFTSCGDTKVLTISPVGAGTASVTASQASNTTGGSFNLGTAAFTVNVAAPAPSNTAPTLTISGATNGASYTKGAVAAAICNVTDAEDGNRSFPATLGAISGDDAATGIGVQEANCSYTDKGGLTAASSITYAIKDGSAPVISYTLSPTTADGSDGWYKSAVALDWTVTEGDSHSTLEVTGCEDQNITEDQLATDFSCSATSAGGNAATQTVNLKKDGTAPTVGSAGATGTEGTNGWYTSDVEASFTGTDATSGLLASTQTVTSSGEGAAVEATSPAFTDIAGNTTEAGAALQTFKIDKTAPRVSYDSATGTSGFGGWYTSDVQAIFRAADLTSGPLSATQTATSSGEGAAVTVKSPAFADNAGNTTAAGAASQSFMIDKTAPAVNYTEVASGTLGKNDWYVSDVEARFTATDETSGLLTSSQTVSSNGQEAADAKVSSPVFVDNAGNTTPAGTVSQTFKIDKSAPVVSYANASGIRGNNGWYTSAVEATFEATDLVSGPLEATKKVWTSGEGEAVEVISPEFEDLAGNVRPAGAAKVVYKIDATAPTVQFNSVVTSDYYGSTAPEPTCTATDELSGVNGNCVVTGYSDKVGTHTLEATATDKAGNKTTIQHRYTVKAWTLKGFYQPVDMNGVLNTVKGGSTVPAKFEVFAGDKELTDPSLTEFTAAKIQCTSGTPEDALEVVATGNTSLRYDAIAGQFVYNWKTPTGTGICYKVTMTAKDGSSISANFKVK
ncbi:MAG: hypothetical protein JWQ56_2987 [Pseudarthrobacter sp.]|nr:hypothetical protein [Pseudarthrobacter sp.]